MLWHKDSVFEPDEMAIRFKHRLVSIHCFPNGNGRSSRQMADIIIEKIYGREVFAWGTGDLFSSGQSRTNYLKTIKLADNGEILPLIEFAKS